MSASPVAQARFCATSRFLLKRPTDFSLAHPPPSTHTPQKTPRPVTVLGRLVGGDRRGGGFEESTTDGPAPGTMPAEAGGEFDELPIPSVCRLLRDGWSRRASSAYSPFFDGEGAWSRSEAAGVSGEEGDGDHPRTPPRGEGGRPQEDDRKGSGDGEGGTMPVPIVAADMLIADLSFSLRYVRGVGWAGFKAPVLSRMVTTPVNTARSCYVCFGRFFILGGSSQRIRLDPVPRAKCKVHRCCPGGRRSKVACWDADHCTRFPPVVQSQSMAMLYDTLRGK